jgi:hypothetical protein
VLLCRLCTSKVANHDVRERDRISREFTAPIEGIGPRYVVQREFAKVSGAAATLLKYSGLPQERIDELKKELCIYLQKEELLDEDIISLANLESKLPNPDFVSHEQIVVNALKSQEDIEKFVFRWRTHFVETMKPNYLPTNWRVDRPLEPIEI